MITTKRNGSANTSYSQSNSSVAVLDRPASSYASFTSTTTNEETLEQANARMRENLQKLLNYDRYAETVVDSAVIEDTPVETEVETQVVETVTDCLDEDIRPTSTTMQFGDDADVDIRNEAKNVGVEAKSSYKLSFKGKLVIALYSVVVALVFALIILNTTVLSNIRGSVSQSRVELANVMSEYRLSEETLLELENSVPEKAEELGMIK